MKVFLTHPENSDFVYADTNSHFNGKERRPDQINVTKLPGRRPIINSRVLVPVDHSTAEGNLILLKNMTGDLIKYNGRPVRALTLNVQPSGFRIRR